MSSDDDNPGSEPTRIRVYRRGPWPIRLLGGALVVVGAVTIVADHHHSPAALIVLTLTAALLVLCTERAGVQVSSEGIRSVPVIGRARTFAWSEITGFAVGKVPGGYGGPVVAMSLTNRTVFLTPTEYRFGGKRAVELICGELNTELRRARRGHR
jgi:hypothetical protein